MVVHKITLPYLDFNVPTEDGFKQSLSELLHVTDELAISPAPEDFHIGVGWANEQLSKMKNRKPN